MGCILIKSLLPLFFCWLSFNSSFDLCLTIKISVRKKTLETDLSWTSGSRNLTIVFLVETHFKPSVLLQGFYLTEENYLTEVLSSFFESLLWSCCFSFVSSGRHGLSHGLCREWECQSRFSKFAFLVAFPHHLPVIYHGDALEVICFRICCPSDGNVSLKWSDCKCLDSGWTGGIYVILAWNHIWLLKKFIFNWRITALEYWFGFCHTSSTWITHRCTYAPLSHLPPFPIPLTCYRAPVWTPWVI